MKPQLISKAAFLALLCALLFAAANSARGEPLLPRDPKACYEAYWLRPGVNQGLVILSAESGSVNAYVVYYDHFVRWYFGEGVPTVWSGVLEPGVPYAVVVEPGTYVLVLYPTECGKRSRIYGWVWYMAPLGVSSLYPVNTSGVLGYFRVDAIRAYYASSMFEEGQESASLQLNSVLELKTSEGSTEYLSLQMVLQFRTKKQRFRTLTNIWALTGDLAYYDLRGRGKVTSIGPTRWYYSESDWLDYQLPLEGFLYHHVDTRGGKVNVYLGAILLRGSKEASFLWFDNITLVVHQEDVYIVDAHIAAHSKKLASYKPEAGLGYPLNVELVFGGVAAGEPTEFRSLDAKLAIFYLNERGLWEPFPEIYNFGLLTAEGATNLGTSLDDSGLVRVQPVSKLSFGLITKQANPRVAGVTTPLILVQQYNRTGGLSKTIFSESPTRVCYDEVVPQGGGERYYLRNVSLSVFEPPRHWNWTVITRPVTGGCVSLEPSPSGFVLFNVMPVYAKQYLVKIPPYAEVDGVRIENGSLWVDAGRKLRVQFPREVALPNQTKLVLSDEPVKEVAVSSPSVLQAIYRRLYLVSVTSRFPAVINGKLTVAYEEWAEPGTELRIESSEVFAEGVFWALEPASLVVDKPMSIVLSWRVNMVKTVSIYAGVVCAILALSWILGRRRSSMHTRVRYRQLS